MGWWWGIVMVIIVVIATIYRSNVPLSPHPQHPMGAAPITSFSGKHRLRRRAFRNPSALGPHRIPRSTRVVQEEQPHPIPVPRSAPEKMTAAMWPKPRDSSIYADMTVDAGPIRRFLGAAEAAGYRLTPTAVVAQAVGQVLVEHPEANRDLRGMRLRDRDAIDVWVTMTDDDGRLLGRRVDELDERDVLDVQQEITAEGRAHKEKSSLTSRVVHGIVRWTPLLLLKPLVRVLEFIVHTLRIPVPVQGINREGFGAVHITNVGPFGLTHVAPPIPPITGQASLVSVGQMYETPVVRDGEVVPGWELPVVATIDHRIVVGITAAKWVTRFQELMTDLGWLVGQLPPDARKEVEAELDGVEVPTPARS